LGLVASINRPGGNITGINTLLGEVTTKHVGLLRELLPDAKTIAVLANSYGAFQQLQSDAREAALRQVDNDAYEAAAKLGPFFDTFEDEPFCFQLLMHRNIVVSTTPT
jgi:putative ABC transport system substrate-binding protein